MPPRILRHATALSGALATAASGLALVAFAPAAQAVPVSPAPDCSAATTCTVTFGYTGGAQTLTIPARVTKVTAIVQGASGGDDNRAGLGGVSRTALPVHGGDVLTVAVGQRGSVGDVLGTYGGGGPVRSGSNGASGGGGSFVFDKGQHLVVAAGGGGGHAGLPTADGGDGGGAVGGDGVGYPDSIYAYTGASGGTSTAGGTGGQFYLFGSVYGSAGANGTGPADTDGPGQGGRGGNSVGEEYGGGGGGGGGYYGGGAGGHYQGAGGGSGFTASGLVSTTSTAAHTGDGSVSFTWTKPKPVVTAPRVTASAASPTPKSKYGWYRSAVTIRFSCTATSAPVVLCPKPVTLQGSGVRTLTRTVTAKDGGVATASITVKIDRGAPRVWIKGARAGSTLTKIPAVRCVAFENYSGRYSGLANCTLTRKITATSKANVEHVTWTAVATDKAGNVTRASKTVRLVRK